MASAFQAHVQGIEHSADHWGHAEVRFSIARDMGSITATVSPALSSAVERRSKIRADMLHKVLAASHGRSTV